MTIETQKSEIEEGQNGFPSHFVSPEVKQSKAYTLRWLDAIDKGGKTGGSPAFRNRAEDYQRWRELANGNQPVDQYKPLLGAARKKRAGGKRNRDKISYRAQNWEILAVAPKFVNVLIGRLIGQNNEIGVKAIDGKAMSARRHKKLQMEEWLVNQQFLKQVSQSTGIQFETPLEDDMFPPPTNFQELKIHMEMFYKEHYCLELMDMLNLLNQHDDYPQILKEVAEDLIKVGIAATKTYRVGGRIKRRRCIPERMVTNAVKFDDFRDLQYAGEYWDLTIGELREIAQDQFTEDDYRRIAEIATNNQFHESQCAAFYQENYRYPYDNVKITVLDAIWFSPDQETYQIKPNRYGNTVVYEKEWNWMGHLSENEFNEYPANKANKSRIIRRELNNLYQGMLIVGTDYVFNYGKARDMLRNESNIGTCIGPFMIYTLGFDSLMRQLAPVFHSIQLNWLQYNHHVQKSRPAGLDIEFSALTDVNLKGTAGEKMTPKEVLELYFDTGILLWRRQGRDGQNSNWRPIQELNNGLSKAAADHFQNVINGIDLLRTIVGLNELTDASTPGAETGKFVAQVASGAVEDAIRYLHHAFDQINLGTQKRTVMHISAMAKEGMDPDFAEALGIDTMAFLGGMAEMGAHEYGVYLMRQPTEEMMVRLMGYTQESIKAGWLMPEEAFEIEEEAKKNIYRAVRLMKMYRERKRQQEAAAAEKVFEDELKKNAASSRATAEAEMDKLSHEYELKKEFLYEESKTKIMESRELIRDQLLLEKVKQGGKLSEIEEQRVTELMKINAQGEWDLRIQAKKAEEAKAKAAAKPAVKKAA